jgi:hypothetical protein
MRFMIRDHANNPQVDAEAFGMLQRLFKKELLSFPRYP